MTKLRRWLILLVFILLFAFIVNFETHRREKNLEKRTAKNIPEFFLEQSLTTHYTPDGKVDYQMNSDYLEYFKYNDTANIKQAYFIFYNKDRLPWHSRSDRAIIFNNNEDIQLSGNIKIWQPARQMEITTDSLLLSDSRSIAETSDIIHLKSPVGKMQSQGMKVDFNTEKLQFFSAVSSEYNTKKENVTRKKQKGNSRAK